VWPIPIATPQEILLVDGCEEARDRHLQQFVLDGRDAMRKLPLRAGNLGEASPCATPFTHCMARPCRSATFVGWATSSRSSSTTLMAACSPCRARRRTSALPGRLAGSGRPSRSSTPPSYSHSSTVWRPWPPQLPRLPTNPLTAPPRLRHTFPSCQRPLPSRQDQRSPRAGKIMLLIAETLPPPCRRRPLSHHLGPPAALVRDPIVRMDQLIRLTARLGGRMLRLTPADPPPTAEAAHAQDSARCSPSSRCGVPQTGGAPC